MSLSPTSRSADLLRLRDDGYRMSIIGGMLVVHDVPFVTSSRTVARGALAAPLEMAGDTTVPPSRHNAYWSGGLPCDAHGRPLSKVIQHGTKMIVGAIQIDHMLCNKPRGREFADYHEMMTAYVRLLGSHARRLDPTATAQTRRGAILDENVDSPFHYVDTSTARAGTAALATRLERQTIGIVGLGGTGSYVLDLVSKTPVRAIHVFDGDTFDQHNAFRAPGAPSIGDLETRSLKVDHFAAIYSRIHRGIIAHGAPLVRGNLELIDGLDFVFLCLDDGAAKRPIIRRLQRVGTPFVDVGMGLDVTPDGIVGLVRVTTSTRASRPHVKTGDRIPFADAGHPDPYASNVQVADLNALNAALAVIRWKRLRSFYADTGTEHHSVFAVDANRLFNADQMPPAGGA